MSEELTKPDQLQELGPALESAKGYAAAARARATVAAYRRQWSAFEAWCTNAGAVALPALPETVAAYIASLADAGMRPASIDQALAAIAKAHHLQRHPNPRTFAEVKETRAGIRRRLGVAPTQKAPVPVDALRAMVGATRPGLIGWRDRALLLVGFAGAFRRSELVAFDREDLRFTAAGAELLLRRTKTDQEGAGRRVGIPFGSVPATCPVRALEAWLTASAIQSGPLFRAVDRWGKLGARCSDRDVARIVKRAAASVGFDPQAFSGHSLRAGLVTAAAKAGKSNRTIKRQTGHTSDAMVDRYVRDADLFSDNAAAGIGL